MKDRTQYIGGSDIAAICGVSPWGNPTTVWLEKTGQSIRKKESEAMFWGRALEDIIEKRFFENHPELDTHRQGTLDVQPCYREKMAGQNNKRMEGINRLASLRGVGRHGANYKQIRS